MRAAALLSPVGLVALLLAFACSPDEAPPAPPDQSSPVAAAPPEAGPPGAAASAGPEAPGAPAAPHAPTRLGLWVPAEGSVRPLDDARRIPALLATAKALGVTDLFVQAYRGGRAWFDSGVVDATPFRAARERSGADPFARLLADAHAAGLRVHAWINTLTLSTRRDAALLERLGPGAVQVDRRGRSVLDYPQLEIPEPDRGWYRMGTRQVWLDPAAPSVAETLAAMAGDLVARYPSLDGIHLDYIRYPDVLPFVPGSRFGVGLDFGYGTASRARFRAETGREAPFKDSIANANAWDDWRRERVTEVVERVAGAARRERPDIEISAAVWAYADRAYLAIFQDWRGWLDDHLIDFAVPMAYTLDDRLLRYIATGAVHGVGGDRVWIGIGAWLFENAPERASAQLAFARSLDPAGVSLFSYDAIAESAPLAAALESGASGAALPAAPSEGAP